MASYSSLQRKASAGGCGLQCRRVGLAPQPLFATPAMTVISDSSIWKNRNFVILIFTGFLLSFGGRVYELALPLIIYELTESSVAMGRPMPA